MDLVDLSDVCMEPNSLSFPFANYVLLTCLPLAVIKFLPVAVRKGLQFLQTKSHAATRPKREVKILLNVLCQRLKLNSLFRR